MRIKQEDVLNIAFSTGLFGYDRREVDTFLDQVAEELRTLEREKNELAATAASLANELEKRVSGGRKSEFPPFPAVQRTPSEEDEPRRSRHIQRGSGERARKGSGGLHRLQPVLNAPEEGNAAEAAPVTTQEPLEQSVQNPEPIAETAATTAGETAAEAAGSAAPETPEAATDVPAEATESVVEEKEATTETTAEVAVPAGEETPDAANEVRAEAAGTLALETPQAALQETALVPAEAVTAPAPETPVPAAEASSQEASAAVADTAEQTLRKEGNVSPETEHPSAAADESAQNPEQNGSESAAPQAKPAEAQSLLETLKRLGREAKEKDAARGKENGGANGTH